MSNYIKKHHISFDRVLCSPAVRTTLTAKALTSAVGYKKKDIEYDEDLYMASTSTVMEIIAATSNTINHLAIVSHNPTLTDLVNELGVRLDNLPTCGIVCFSSKKEWSDIIFEYERFVAPKIL
jgi:phosphohistidine phosphatase